MICVSLGRTRHKMVRAEHRALAEKGAELVELRLDWLARQPDLQRLLPNRPTPVVVTCRRESDRGRWSGSEEQRQALLRAAIVAGAEYVDLEADIAADIPRYGETRRIISHHDFEETPENLEEIHRHLSTLDPDIVKLVTMANHPADSLRLLRLVADAEVPTVGFCMGEFGVLSRILCGKYGAPFTYATFSKERKLGPGQLAFAEMREVYRYDSITPATQIFGVLGDPIAHSLSPLLHNRAFAHVGFDGVYLPLRVPADVLNETLEAFRWLDIQGYSVTIPHKQAVIGQAEVADQPVEEIGAANTLFRNAEGRWQASNTDYQAALKTLQLGLQNGDGAEETPGDEESTPEAVLRDTRILMLGAGGVARSIGLGLVRCGASVSITNRTHRRAVELAEFLGCHHLEWENRGTEDADILVNCTSVGMHPHIEESPFPAEALHESMLIFDTVYNPENTLLLKQARQRGCRTVSGVEMFIRQAAAQFAMFTGRSAPLDFLRETFRQGISPVQSSPEQPS